MLLNQEQTKAIKIGSSQGVHFGIGDPSVIIHILRNKLYAHPIRTLVQEYICNARDANREKGVPDEKIKISLDSTEFRVRDLGPGLSPERVIEVFTQYGCSTKRESNEQTGGFGIGAKSAWAYTDAFTVTSWYNGRRSEYLCHLLDSPTGIMEKLYEVEDNSETGVEIKVSIKPDDFYAFSKAIVRAVGLWPIQPEVNLNYTKPECQRYEHLGVTVATHKDWRSGYYISVDGVLYPIEKDTRFPYLFDGVCFIFGFKTGEVEISASREEAVITGDLIEQCVARTEKFWSHCETESKELFNKTPNRQEFFAKLSTVKYFSYKFIALNESISLSREGLKFSNGAVVNANSKEIYYNDTTWVELTIKKRFSRLCVIPGNLPNAFLQWLDAKPLSTAPYTKAQKRVYSKITYRTIDSSRCCLSNIINTDSDESLDGSFYLEHGEFIKLKSDSTIYSVLENVKFLFNKSVIVVTPKTLKQLKGVHHATEARTLFSASDCKLPEQSSYSWIKSKYPFFFSSGYHRNRGMKEFLTLSCSDFSRLNKLIEMYAKNPCEYSHEKDDPFILDIDPSRLHSKSIEVYSTLLEFHKTYPEILVLYPVTARMMSDIDYAATKSVNATDKVKKLPMIFELFIKSAEKLGLVVLKEEFKNT